jgi:hypothetical protein
MSRASERDFKTYDTTIEEIEVKMAKIENDPNGYDEKAWMIECRKRNQIQEKQALLTFSVLGIERAKITPYQQSYALPKSQRRP